MEDKFLVKVAKRLIENHGSDFSSVHVVVPTKRARLFLLEYLKNELKKTFWSPQFYVLPEFMEWMTDGVIASEQDLAIGLYSVYLEYMEAPDKFSEFSKWSSIVLNDFNDLDSSLTDAARVFADLRNIREIEGWSFNQENLTASQKNYLKFWAELGVLYQKFSDWQMANNRWTYHHLIKKTLQDENFPDLKLKGKSIYFLGLASFSPAERTLIDELSKCTQLSVYWNLDDYYLSDEMHEAGYFARKMGVKPEMEWVGNSLTSEAKEIVVHECSTSITQTLAVSELLHNLNPGELNDTCVVLTDEAMLDPLIASLSDVAVPVNLAMGIPLHRSSGARWFLSLLRIRVLQATSGRGVYHQDFSRFVQQCADMGATDSDVKQLQRLMVNQVIVYIGSSELEGLTLKFPSFSKMFELLRAELNPGMFLEKVLELLREIKSPDAYNAVAMEKMIDQIHNMHVLTFDYAFLNNYEALQSLFVQSAAISKIHYQGEPIHGLQILSMVETRSLDFNRVIILGANEDLLPGKSRDQTFIPMDLRSYHKLPLPNENEAMYAYTFYRLLHSPKYVHLFYSTVSSDFRATEKSRYITQLENELLPRNTQVKMDTRVVRTSQPMANGQFALNDDFTKSRLDKLFAEGISPSAINKFISCPLDFYYRYIIGLGEEEELEEQMSSATFGSIVHHVLENFYMEFKNSFPKDEDFVELGDSISERIEVALKSIYSAENVSTGFNALAITVAKKMLLDFIEYEKSQLRERNQTQSVRKIVDIERMMRRELNTGKVGWSKAVSIRGKADRIDEQDGCSLIIDYKTGKVDEKNIKLKNDMADLFVKSDQSKQLQLLTYIFLFNGETISNGNTKAGFYSFLKPQNGFMFLKEYEGTSMNDLMENFETAFLQWVQTIYELEKFEHNSSSRYCEYCRN